MDARVRKNLTIVACATTVFAPLTFAFADRAGLVGWVLRLLTPLIGANRSIEPAGLFLAGWIAWALLSAIWVAWQLLGVAPLESRLFHFIMLVVLSTLFFVVFLFLGGILGSVLVVD